MVSFYEYLSGSGAFNIPQLDADVWNLYESQYAKKAQSELDEDQVEMNVPFLTSSVLDNAELVFTIDQLYEQLGQHSGSTEKPEPCQ